MSDSLCVDSAVVAGPDGATATDPTAATVCAGIGFRKESRKAGVPKVSVNAIQRTFDGLV